MYPCSLFIAGNSLVRSLAEQNVLLVWKFIARHKNTRHMVGGKLAFFSELSEAYMQGIESFLYRKRKFRKFKLSTFVWHELKWELSRIWRENLIRLTASPDDKLRDFTIHQRRAARRIVYFHGREGRCEDSSLLVHDDPGRSMDLADLRIAMDGLLMELPKRHRDIFCMRVLDAATLRECGLRYGVTQEVIRQNYGRAFSRLRKPQRISRLERFAEIFN